jgi:hypothetical protein
MKLLPEDKTKAAVGGIAAAILFGVALYLAFGRGAEQAPQPDEILERQQAISSGTRAPGTAVPEVPPEQRPSRGAPVGPPGR